jgi:hypothetical protein
MGKNRDRDVLIRFLINTVAHKVVRKNTNRPESRDFLSSEIIEYKSRAMKMAGQHTWNLEDLKYIKDKALKGILDKLKLKYSDVNYDLKEVEDFLDEELKDWV